MNKVILFGLGAVAVYLLLSNPKVTTNQNTSTTYPAADTPTGRNDANGQPIYNDGQGGYYTVNGGSTDVNGVPLSNFTGNVNTSTVNTGGAQQQTGPTGPMGPSGPPVNTSEPATTMGIPDDLLTTSITGI